MIDGGEMHGRVRPLLACQPGWDDTFRASGTHVAERDFMIGQHRQMIFRNRDSVPYLIKRAVLLRKQWLGCMIPLDAPSDTCDNVKRWQKDSGS